MADTETQEWWGAAEEESDDASWKTGSDAKQQRIDLYIEWLLTPRPLRDPPSKAKLADELNVTPQTLRNYDKDPIFQRKLMEDARAVVKVDRVPDMLDTLYNQATDPNNPRSVSAAKVLLDHIEKMVPTEEVEGIDVRSMDKEALANLAIQLLNKISDDD